MVEDEELERIEIESTHVIEIDSFVPRQEIDQRFFDTPYYVTPNEPVAQETFAVIREKKAIGFALLQQYAPWKPANLSAIDRLLHGHRLALSVTRICGAVRHRTVPTKVDDQAAPAV